HRCANMFESSVSFPWSLVFGLSSLVLPYSGGLLVTHTLLDDGRNQTAHVAAETEDFLDQAGAQIRGLRGRHHEHRFQRRFEMPVHERHLKLEFEVGHRTHPADDGART